MASEYLRWKYKDVQPNKPVTRTKKQRRQNWWHYHKWHVILGLAAVCIAGNLGTDCNGDGKIVVQVNQYLSAQEDVMYAAASNVRLMADLDACESYFFLLEDPEGFQQGYEVLQEDWFPVENGLYLARRTFWENRVPKNIEDCGALWERLRKEAA